MSSEISVPIENFIIVTTNIVTSFKVQVIGLHLFTCVDLTVYLFDSNNNVVKCECLKISGNDYNSWTNNDEYIINYVANYYGFRLKSNSSTDDVVTDVA
jgi:hypothetical protein